MVGSDSQLTTVRAHWREVAQAAVSVIDVCRSGETTVAKTLLPARSVAGITVSGITV
jgi:hypothetical protein